MRKTALFLMLCCGFGFTAQAQKYRTAAGVRLSSNSLGGTLQQKISEHNTLEGIALLRSKEISATLLFEHHNPILGKALNYYVGAGAHIGHLKEYGTFYGPDAILGLEWKLPILPFVVSGDLKPAIHINHEDWVNLDAGFSVRYVLLKEKKKENKFKIFGNDKDDDRKSGKKKSWFQKEEPVEEKKRSWFQKEEPVEEKKRGWFEKEKPVEEKKRGWFEKEEPEPERRKNLFDKKEPQPEPEKPKSWFEKIEPKQEKKKGWLD